MHDATRSVLIHGLSLAQRVVLVQLVGLYEATARAPEFLIGW